VLKPSPVLDAREQRWLKKKELGRAVRARFPGQTIAVAFCTLRMPAPLRFSGAYGDLPAHFQEVLRSALAANSIRALDSGIDSYPDGPSAWIAASCSLEQLKRFAIQLEEEHSLGALIDIDISGADGEPLSRRELGFSARRCLVCGEDAAVCAASQRHSLDEIEARVRVIARK